MSGIFRSSSRDAAPVAAPVATPAPTTPAAAAAAPAAMLAAAPAGVGLGETRAPVTRASTMLSNRRAGDDVRVGTKRLLGQ